MNTRELLIKLAGNDVNKMLAAEYWAHTLEFINMFPIELKTEAQAKVLLQFPDADVDICQGAIALFIHAIDLKEPVFLENAIKLINSVSLGASDITMLACALDVLTVEARRMLLKSLPNAYSFIDVANKAADYRYKLEFYERCDECTYVDNEYRAAWYITCGAYDCCTIEGAWSLKKIKAALKTPERIDRYAQIEHVEYDYSSDAALYIRTVLDMSGLNYRLFASSEELAEEGAMMHNCIASYWDKHTKSTFGDTCFVLSAEYKGQHIDIELRAQRNEVEYSSYYITVEQIRLEYNESLEKNDEKRIIALIGDAAIELFNDQLSSHTNTTRQLTGETACFRYEMLPALGITLYDEFGFGEKVYSGHMFSVMEGVADAHGPYIYTPSCILRVVKLTQDIVEVIDITDTPEGCAASDIFHSKFTAIDDDYFEDDDFEDDDFDDYDDDFAPQFLDDYELFD